MPDLWQVPVLGARPEAESPLTNLILQTGLDVVFVIASSPLEACNRAEQIWILDDSRPIIEDGTDYKFPIANLLNQPKPDSWTREFLRQEREISEANVEKFIERWLRDPFRDL